MPRTTRAVKARGYYHVLNRGNGRQRLFHKDADFAAFARILADGLRRYSVEMLAWCLMSNHWHLVLRPMQPDALARFMGWVGVTHVRRHHEHYHTRCGGHLYQGRFTSFPIQDARSAATWKPTRYGTPRPPGGGLAVVQPAGAASGDHGGGLAGVVGVAGVAPAELD